jgi:5-methylcytosine-specific restriction endonuclease McrA
MQSIQLSLFDGKVCSKCHQWKPLNDYCKQARCFLGHKSYCKQCGSALATKYQRQHRSETNAYWRVWYTAHVETERVRGRAKWRKNLDANRARARQQGRVRYWANPEKHRRYVSAWIKRNPTFNRQLQKNRRARKAGAVGSHTHAEWLDLKARYDSRCLCCGQQEPTIRLVRDHVIPLSKGGANSIDNIQPLCVTCNGVKYVQETDYRPSVTSNTSPA